MRREGVLTGLVIAATASATVVILFLVGQVAPADHSQTECVPTTSNRCTPVETNP